VENNLNFNYDEILEFLNKVELNKENIMEVIEFVHYKSVLDTITYIIEKGKETQDTTYIAIDYIQIMKKVEDIIKKISIKHELSNANKRESGTDDRHSE